jgi:hypothetical protein
LTRAVATEGPDKYALGALPEIDCESLLPLCGARCCTHAFVLWKQDIDEGVVRTDGTCSNRIARRADGFCVHNAEGRCSVYVNRPAGCRTYDCRRDSRIWADFASLTPAK